MLNLFKGLAAKVTNFDHFVLSLANQVFNSVDVCSLQAIEAADGKIQLFNGHLKNLVSLLLNSFNNGLAGADVLAQVGEDGEVIAEYLCTQADSVTSGDGLVSPYLDGQLVKIGLVTYTGVLHSVVDLQYGGVDGVDGNGSDDSLCGLVSVSGDIASAVADGQFHAERSVGAEGSDVEIGIEDLNFAIGLDVAGGYFALACRLDVNGLGALAMKS